MKAIPTNQSNCKLCKLTEEKDNPTYIYEFESGVAFVNFDQTYLGRSMIVVKPHYDSLLDLPTRLTALLMKDVKILTRAILDAYNPERINYLMLGNTVLHAHCHILPRYRNAPRWALSPLLPAVGEYEKQSSEFYKKVAGKIRSRLVL